MWSKYTRKFHKIHFPPRHSRPSSFKGRPGKTKKKSTKQKITSQTAIMTFYSIMRTNIIVCFNSVFFRLWFCLVFPRSVHCLVERWNLREKKVDLVQKKSPLHRDNLAKYFTDPFRFFCSATSRVPELCVLHVQQHVAKKCITRAAAPEGDLKSCTTMHHRRRDTGTNGSQKNKKISRVVLFSTVNSCQQKFLKWKSH